MSSRHCGWPSRPQVRCSDGSSHRSYIAVAAEGDRLCHLFNIGTISSRRGAGRAPSAAGLRPKNTRADPDAQAGQMLLAPARESTMAPMRWGQLPWRRACGARAVATV